MAEESGPGGRPRDYDDPEVFAKRVEEYFTETAGEEKKPTLSGISLYLGFSDRETFSNYAGYGDEFSRTVNRAKMRIEDHRHQMLVDKNAFTPGIIFDLKNNHGWKDKQELEHTVSDDVAEMLDAARKRAQQG